MKDVFDVSDIVKLPEKTKFTLARHNTRGPDRRHAPCMLEKRTAHKLKPLKRKILEKSLEMYKQEQDHKKAQVLKLNCCLQSFIGCNYSVFFFAKISAVRENFTARVHQRIKDRINV